MGHSIVRKFGVLLVCAAVGALAYRQFLPDISPKASVDLRYSRSEIMTMARDYLAGLGYDLRDYQQDAWFGFETMAQMLLQVRHGMTTANAMLRADSIAAHNWYVSWYDRRLTQTQNPESFVVWLSPAGRVLGFEHHIRDTVARRSMSDDEARLVAQDFLTRQSVDLTPYTLRSSSSTNQVHRTDHNFVWAKGDTAADDVLWLRVQGEEVGGYRMTWTPAGVFQKIASDIGTTATFVITASYAAVFLLFFFIVILFLKKYHEGEVGTRTALMVFVGLFVVSLLATLNEYAMIGSGVQVGEVNKFNVRIVMLVVSVFIISVFMGVMVFAAWSVGESSSRSAWPRKMTAMDSLLFRHWFTADVGEAVVRGYAWGLILLGCYAGLLFVLIRAFGIWLYIGSTGGVAEAALPAVHPLLAGIAGAVTCEIIYRFFFLSYLKEKLKKTWLAVLIAALVWAATATTVMAIPFGQPGFVQMYATMFCIGLVLCLLFLRYDLLTTITATFVLLSLDSAIPLFVAGGPYFHAMANLFLALFALPLVLAVIGLIKRERFEFTAESTPDHVRRISERERMAKELEIARNVQMSLLPKANPIVAGYDIAGVCIPALEVGGDYYDFVRLGENSIGIAVGDVSGKGVPAAIYMTLTKGILQSHAEDNVSPKRVLSKVNSLMYRTIERNSFVSMFYAILDVKGRTIRFARAGQCPVILTQQAAGTAGFLTPRGMALGLERGDIFDEVLEEEERALQPGEVLVFYTDGFTEARNEAGEEFGESRLVEAVARHRELGASAMADALCREVQSFAAGRPQHDDMTMVVVKVTL
jgi:sigma-B regulation protein RsbU (phosphoserine phosphatase)